jgi:8-oxo-dGTP pyrophosphatase MutT (NUDIX family)
MVEVPERRQAGVLILLFERDEEPWVVLTERTHTVRMHKGEISFPGGARDPEDEDLWATAVRETVEELGIDPNSLQLLGALDDYPTFASGYIVSPFVAAIEPPKQWQPSEHEIATVIELPLRALIKVWRMEVWERDGIRFPMHIFEVDGHRVWGVTAFILRRFLDIVGPALAEGD